jgi:hypothetical protein
MGAPTCAELAMERKGEGIRTAQYFFFFFFFFLQTFRLQSNSKEAAARQDIHCIWKRDWDTSLNKKKAAAGAKREQASSLAIAVLQGDSYRNNKDSVKAVADKKVDLNDSLCRSGGLSSVGQQSLSLEDVSGDVKEGVKTSLAQALEGMQKKSKTGGEVQAYIKDDIGPNPRKTIRRVQRLHRAGFRQTSAAKGSRVGPAILSMIAGKSTLHWS